jgi:hypothetical protein
VQLVSRCVILSNVVGARIAMILKLVVIDNCAFSGEYCKQFVQFVVRHKAPHGILGREGYHYILCPTGAASYDCRYRSAIPLYA